MNQKNNNIHESVAEIVDKAIDDLSVKDRVTLASFGEEEISIIHTLMTDYIRSKVNEWSILHEETHLTEPRCIIKEIWKRLRETHKLRVVE